MRLATLVLENIRNHGRTELALAGGVNVFYGMNGQGKTSVLEAVSLVGFSTTFVPGSDLSLVRRGAESAFASASAYSDLDTLYKVSVRLRPGERKDIHSSLGKRLSPQDIIGEIPLVTLSPDNKNITAGAPQDRRKLVDSVISQASRRYMKDLVSYRRILKQRNALLNRGRSDYGFDYGLVEPWTEALADVGAEIVVRRAEFLRSFSVLVQRAYSSVAGGDENVGFVYTPNSLPPDMFTGQRTPPVADVRAQYQAVASGRRREERARGVTAFGPQKDEIVMTVNGGVARECASQGQHKTLLIAVKMAEFEYLREIRLETPVVLLDDIFSELDAQRATNVLDLMRSDAQTFVTTTDPAIFYSNFSASDRHALFAVRGGEVHREQ